MTKIFKIATLYSDMAHRIMFSLSPPGEFNITAARWAASGAKDIIIYATKSCLNEMQHYGVGRAGSREAIKIKKLLEHYEYTIKLNKNITEENYNIYKETLLICSKEFMNKAGWSSSLYGGEAWKKIATTTLDLLSLYVEWKTTEKDTPEEESIIKKILVKMNVFDGLAHNTNSIYDKMIKMEHYDTEGVPKGSEELDVINDKFQNLMKLRNISESDEPAMVYKSIKDVLSPKVPHKDTIQKIVSDPDYFKHHDLDQFSRDIATIKELKESDYHLIDLQYLVESIESATKHIDMDEAVFNIYLKNESSLSLHKTKLIGQVKNLDNNIDCLKHSMINIETAIKLLNSLLDSIKSPKLQTKSIVLAKNTAKHLESLFNQNMKEVYILLKETNVITKAARIPAVPFDKIKELITRLLNNYTKLINNLALVCKEFESFVGTLKGL